MKDFFTDFITLLFFAVAVALFYAAFTVVYPTIVINFIIICFAIFVLLKGCKRVDEALNFGQHSKN